MSTHVKISWSKSLKRGFKKTFGLESREPITLELLKKLLDALRPVCDSLYEQNMLKFAYLPAFFGLFRIGEIVADMKDRPQKSVILISNISLKPSFLKIVIRFSKTDQTGKTNSIIFEGQKGNPLCPVEATLEFIKIRGPKPGEFKV